MKGSMAQTATPKFAGSNFCLFRGHVFFQDEWEDWRSRFAGISRVVSVNLQFLICARNSRRDKFHHQQRMWCSYPSLLGRSTPWSQLLVTWMKPNSQETDECSRTKREWYAYSNPGYDPDMMEIVYWRNFTCMNGGCLVEQMYVNAY